MPIDPFKPVTFSAVRRRLGRANSDSRRISKMRRWQSPYFNGGSYAVEDNNVILAYGQLTDVEAWCRYEGVLLPHEFLKDAA